jgi:3-dehydroquinate dehydratase
MAQQTTRTSTGNRAVARIFSSPFALAFVRKAVACGQTQAEARKRYLDFANRSHVTRSPRAA